MKIIIITLQIFFSIAVANVVKNLSIGELPRNRVHHYRTEHKRK